MLNLVLKMKPVSDDIRFSNLLNALLTFSILRYISESGDPSLKSVGKVDE